MNLPRSTLGGPMRCHTPRTIGAEPIDPAVLQASIEAGTQVLVASNTLLQAHANKAAAARQSTARRKRRKAPAVVAPPPAPPKRTTSWIPFAVVGGLVALAAVLHKPKKAVS